MSREKGEILYKIYRALTYCLSPAVHLHLRWRKFRGLEHPRRWPERLGRPSLRRPVGPLVWFLAVSLGEGELHEFYRLTPIAVIGGSFLPGSAGHNISEADTAGCAILTGHYVGHFSHGVKEMQRLNPLSVKQVSEEMLVQSLIELFSDAKVLKGCQIASKQAYHALSCGVLESIWSIVQLHILEKAILVGKL